MFIRKISILSSAETDEALRSAKHKSSRNHGINTIDLASITLQSSTAFQARLSLVLTIAKVAPEVER
jgi:hypothetical protein